MFHRIEIKLSSSLSFITFTILLHSAFVSYTLGANTSGTISYDVISSMSEDDVPRIEVNMSAATVRFGERDIHANADVSYTNLEPAADYVGNRSCVSSGQFPSAANGSNVRDVVCAHGYVKQYKSSSSNEIRQIRRAIIGPINETYMYIGVLTHDDSAYMYNNDTTNLTCIDKSPSDVQCVFYPYYDCVLCFLLVLNVPLFYCSVAVTLVTAIDHRFATNDPKVIASVKSLLNRNIWRLKTETNN